MFLYFCYHNENIPFLKRESRIFPCKLPCYAAQTYHLLLTQNTSHSADNILNVRFPMLTINVILGLSYSAYSFAILDC